MSDGDEVSVVGEIDSSASRADLARALTDAGYAAEAGAFALRLRLAGERVEFTRDEIGYVLCAGFATPESRACLPDFSAALGRLGLRHRFATYEGDECVGYVHHAWEPDEDNDSGES